MPLIYVTGPSGAGKSTVRKELQKRGYEAHDTDEDGISAWHSIETNEKVKRPSEANRSPDWYKHRVANRETNTFGKSPDELKLMLYWHGKMLERYEKFGAVMIDAMRPLDEVVNDVLKAARA
jgi:hypothetical protein